MLMLPQPLSQIGKRLLSGRGKSSRDPSLAKRLRLRARTRWLRAKIAPWPGVELTRRTWRELGDDHSVDLAASIAYYAVLSIFPLAIGLVSLFSFILEADTVEAEVHRFFHTYLPGSHGILEANVASVENIRGVLGIVSLIGLLWSASLLFGAITRTVNRAWDIEQDRPFYVDKPRQILMALCVAPFFLASLVLTSGLQFIASEEIPVLGRLAFLEHNGINALARPIPFFFTFVIFLFIYKFTPMTRTYWRYMWPGALVAALLFEAAKSFFIFYLDHYAAYERIYGTLASVIVLLIWAYVSGLIVVIGAEISSEYYRLRIGAPRGLPVYFPGGGRPGRRRRSR